MKNERTKKEMKTHKLSILIVITAIAVNIISTLCGIFIWQCEDMLPTSKYSFTCIILGAVGFSVYFFLRLFQSNEAEKNQDIIDKKDELINTLSKQIADKDSRISELVVEVFSKKDLSEDILKLQNKCEALENYRSSFPYKIAEGYVIYNIIRLELTATYSKWLIVGIFEDDLWSYPIMRPAEQKYKEMLRLISSTKEPEDIKELEQSENLFWE